MAGIEEQLAAMASRAAAPFSKTAAVKSSAVSPYAGMTELVPDTSALDGSKGLFFDAVNNYFIDAGPARNNTGPTYIGMGDDRYAQLMSQYQDNLPTGMSSLAASTRAVGEDGSVQQPNPAQLGVTTQAIGEEDGAPPGIAGPLQSANFEQQQQAQLAYQNALNNSQMGGPMQVPSGLMGAAGTPPPNPFNAVNDNIKNLSDTVQSLGSAYQNDVSNLNTSVSGLQDQFGTLNTGFTDLQNQVGGFSDQFGSLNTGLSDLQGQFGGFQEQFGNMQNQFGSLQDSFSNQLNEGIGSITSQFGSLQNDLKGSLENIDNRVDTLEQKVDNQPANTPAPAAPQGPQNPYYSAQGSYGSGAGYGGFSGYNYPTLPVISQPNPYLGFAMNGYQTMSPYWLASLGVF